MLLPRPVTTFKLPSVNTRMTKRSRAYQSNAISPATPKPQSEIKPVAQQVIHQQTFQHSGPLPDPSSLDRYNQIVPNAAERIIKMAELNADHLRNIEVLALTAQVDEAKRRHSEVRTGQIFGLVSVISAFLVAAYALHLNHTGVAGTICGVTVVGLVTVFITGKMANPKQDVTPTNKNGEARASTAIHPAPDINK
jgi:uncharacterized membrane protein